MPGAASEGGREAAGREGQREQQQRGGAGGREAWGGSTALGPEAPRLDVMAHISSHSAHPAASLCAAAIFLLPPFFFTYSFLSKLYHLYIYVVASSFLEIIFSLSIHYPGLSG